MTDPHENARTAALRWAVRTHPHLTEAVSRLHPEGDAVARPAPNQQTLADILLRETIGRGTPVAAPADRIQYWSQRRRRAMDAEWTWLLGSLPNLYRVLIELPARSVEAMTVEVGLELVARSTPPDTDLRTWLEPLGADLGARAARRVENLADADPVELGSLPDAWRQLYEQASDRRRGTALLRTIALAQLGALVRERVGEPRRQAAARHGRTDLFGLLTPQVTLAVLRPDAAIVDALEAVVLESVGRVNGGDA